MHYKGASSGGYAYGGNNGNSKESLELFIHAILFMS